MKIICLLIVGVLTISSCSSKKGTITEFERVLGQENSETLTYLVQDFENDFLANEFPNLEIDEAYRQFILELRDGKNHVWRKISKNSKNLFSKSALRYEIYSVPDSVWIEYDKNNLTSSLKVIPVLKIRRKSLQQDGTFLYGVTESIFSYKEPINEDSIVKKYMNYVDVNFVGSYIRALNSIPNKSPFLKNYIESRNAAGLLSPIIIVNRMLSSNVDFNDYFIKRLIITEIAY